MLELPKRDKLKILSSYLTKHFWIKVNQQEHEQFKKMYPKMGTFYVQKSNINDLRKVGAYFLLEWGQKQWRMSYSYDSVQAYISSNNVESENELFYDDKTPFLIVWHMAGTMVNKQLDPMNVHQLTKRYLEGLPTLILSQIPWPTIEQLVRSFKSSSTSSAQIPI